MTVSERLKVNSRVRVVAVTIREKHSQSTRHRLLSYLGKTGTVYGFDPRWTYPYAVRLNDGRCSVFVEDNLEVLES